jgi:hypothetical protein
MAQGHDRTEVLSDFGSSRQHGRGGLPRSWRRPLPLPSWFGRSVIVAPRRSGRCAAPNMNADSSGSKEMTRRQPRFPSVAKLFLLRMSRHEAAQHVTPTEATHVGRWIRRRRALRQRVARSRPCHFTVKPVPRGTPVGHTLVSATRPTVRAVGSVAALVPRSRPCLVPAATADSADPCRTRPSGAAPRPMRVTDTVFPAPAAASRPQQPVRPLGR